LVSAALTGLIVQKPVARMFIVAIICDMSQSSAPALPPDERKPARILLVDDNARNLDALESILASSDYLLHRA
jgi:PleD family two-component response regulator